MHVIRRILMLPVRFVRFVWEFVNPRLKAGRDPLGRIVIVTQSSSRWSSSATR